MAQSTIFGNFIKSNLTLVAKHHFILMTCSAITQIEKNRCRETFVSKVEKELNDIRFSKLGKFSDLA
jgi:hypothetical protein